MRDSDSETSEEEADKMEYVDMIKDALFESRKILENLEEQGFLKEQIREIFNLFTGNLITEVEDDVSLNWSQSGISESRAPSEGEHNLEILAMPQFIKYFRVSYNDEGFFETTLEKLAELASVTEYVENGLPFENLINELTQVNFLMGCELTD